MLHSDLLLHSAIIVTCGAYAPRVVHVHYPFPLDLVVRCIIVSDHLTWSSFILLSIQWSMLVVVVAISLVELIGLVELVRVVRLVRHTWASPSWIYSVLIHDWPA